MAWNWVSDLYVNILSEAKYGQAEQKANGEFLSSIASRWHCKGLVYLEKSFQCQLKILGEAVS